MRSSEPKKDKAIGIRLPLETFEKLKAHATAERRSVSNYLLLLIERDLEVRESPAIRETRLYLEGVRDGRDPDLGNRFNEPAPFPPAGTAKPGQPSPGAKKSGGASS